MAVRFLNGFNLILGVMVRLLLVLAPAVAIMAGIGGSVTIRFLTKSLRQIMLPVRVKHDKEGKVNKSFITYIKSFIFK